VLLLAGGAFVLAWDFSGFDLPLMRLFGSAGGFAWQQRPWALALHEIGRAACAAVLLLLLANAVRPLGFLPRLAARERWMWLGVSVGSLLAISALKQHSLTSCPWELREFGGRVPFVSHWSLQLSDGGPGHCFPSGHASSGFGLLVGYWLLRDASQRAARVWLAMALVLGVLCGGVQLVRGAHFLSHSLWTAWCCWAIALAAASLRRLPATAAPASWALTQT
jgi:membrane-associated PAP2 superfamily phosphatase